MEKYYIKDLKEETKKGLIDSMYDSKIDGGVFCDYSSSSYICDAIMEIADYNTDIYNNDLFEWAKGNYSVIEEANEELGTPNDIIKQIQQGQYIQNERDIYDNLKEMLYLYCLDLLEGELEEITAEQNEKLVNYCDGLDNNDYLPDIEDIKDAIRDEEDDDEDIGNLYFDKQSKEILFSN